MNLLKKFKQYHQQFYLLSSVITILFSTLLKIDFLIKRIVIFLYFPSSRTKIGFFTGLTLVVIFSSVSVSSLPLEVPLRIRNGCSHPIRIAVEYIRNKECPPQGGDCFDYYEGGWWHFEPGESAALTDNGEDLLIYPPDTQLGIYAESTDGSNLVWRGRQSIITMNNPRLFLRDGSPLPYTEGGKVNSESVRTLTCGK